jgi:hypothetical protein
LTPATPANLALLRVAYDALKELENALSDLNLDCADHKTGVEIIRLRHKARAAILEIEGETQI